MCVGKIQEVGSNITLLNVQGKARQGFQDFITLASEVGGHAALGKNET